jgi:beta-glucanase (GH16 family)
MLGNDISEKNWPTCGEIDIMENIGREPSTVHTTLHGTGYTVRTYLTVPANLVHSKIFRELEATIYSQEPSGRTE